MSPELLTDLASPPRDFLELMRSVDARAASGERTPSRSELVLARRRPAWLQLQQPARMDFAPTEISALELLEQPSEHEPWRLRISIRHFGLFAPYGPLPLHITEHAQHEHKVVLEKFLGYLTADLTWLDFKAWAKWHPVVGCDVPSRGNEFVRRLSHLSSVADDITQPDVGGGTGTARHISVCRTHFVGIYASHQRPLGPLRVLLGQYFRIPVAIVPRTGGWLEVEGGLARPRRLARWILGRRVFAPQAMMTIVVGPIDAEDFQRLHRKQPTVDWLVGVAEDYAAGKVHARVVVDVRTRSGMNGRVGRMRIGVDTWASPLDRIARLIVREPVIFGATS